MAGDTAPLPELPPDLLAEYLESARSQLGVLARLAERLTAARGDREALAALRLETHKLLGSAGSYGFMEASRLAAGMEATVKDWVTRPAERDVDRGQLTTWFVRRLAEMLGIVTAPVQPAATAPSADTAAVPEIIYVEDDAALAELLEYGLRARAYRFRAYHNGRDALRDLLALDVRGTQPLLLLDIDLPALGGYSIFDTIQRERPGIYRMVFTTVHGAADERVRGREAGVLDYLVKPVSLGVALEKIERWVGR